MLAEGSAVGSLGTATKSQLDSWITSLGVTFSYVRDSAPPQPFVEDFFGVSRDSFIIIDLKTMKIVEVLGAGSGGVAQAITDLEALLK